jgi:hypothetical protein
MRPHSGAETIFLSIVRVSRGRLTLCGSYSHSIDVVDHAVDPRTSLMAQRPEPFQQARDLGVAVRAEVRA